MQRKAIIFHGTGGRPEYCWYPWLGQQLAGRGYAVDIPHYPDLNIEPVATFLPKVLANHGFDEHTVLVGHSGAPRCSWRSSSTLTVRCPRPLPRRVLHPAQHERRARPPERLRLGGHQSPCR